MKWKRERDKWNERHYIKGKGKFPPKQCLLTLLVKVYWRECEALGEEGAAFGTELCHE
jgi:hypothetical protein